jgi:alpha-L-rhamnosidase
MAEFARLLGKDSSVYIKKAQYLKELIQHQYFNRKKALFSNGSQSAQGVALYLGLVPKGYEQKVADHLSEMIAANGEALDCGMLGSKTILRMLCKYGHADQAFRISNRTDIPSWGNWIKRGLTSLAETWNLSPTFKDASLNHIFLGDINAWMYNVLAGINYDPRCPGFKHILLQPHFVKGLHWVKCEYNSPMGMIKSEWFRKKEHITLNIEIPANTTATLTVNGKNQELSSGRHHFVF